MTSEIEIQADDQTIELARRLGEARQAVKQWGEVADFNRDELLARVKEVANEQGIADPRTVVASGVKVVSISETDRRILDIDRLKAEHPEIDFDKYYRISTSTTVRIGKI